MVTPKYLAVSVDLSSIPFFFQVAFRRQYKQFETGNAAQLCSISRPIVLVYGNEFDPNVFLTQGC